MSKKKPSKGSRGTTQKNNGLCYWDNDVLVLNILGKPSAKGDGIGKIKGQQLKVSVTAAPKAGKATDHMVAFLAREFQVKKSAIEVVFGRMNINKQLRITAPDKLPAVLEKYLQKQSTKRLKSYDSPRLSQAVK